MQLHRPPKPKQSGFSVIEVLLLVLVVAALAVIGFVVYQRHNPSSAKASASTGSTQTTMQPTQATTQYLNISDWGVRIKLDSDTASLYYYIKPDLPDVAYLSLQTISDIAPNCAADKTSLGAIVRQTPAEQQSAPDAKYSIKGTKQIGNYWYGYSNSHAACIDASMQAAVNRVAPNYNPGVLFNAINTLEEAPTQYIYIKEWGIKVKLEDADKLTYTMNGTPNGASANADGIVSYAALSLKDSITTSPKCKPLTTSISQHLAASNNGEGANMITVGKYAYGIGGGPNSCDVNAINTLQEKIFSELLKRNIVAE